MTAPRVALIGLGGIAQSVHLPLLQRNRADLELVALVELSASRLSAFGERYGVPTSGRFAGVEDLVQAISTGSIGVDAAILATGGGHTDEARALVGAGVRVLVEKPLGWSAEDLDALEADLIALDRAPHEWLRVGYMKEYDPAVEAAQQLLREVTPREVRVEVLHPADHVQLQFARLSPAPGDIEESDAARLLERGQRSITEATQSEDATLRKLWSNVLLGSVIHDLALTRHLGLGLDKVIHAERIGSEFPGSVVAAGRTATAVPWNLSWHFIADYPEYRETITVHHERGSIQLDFATPYILNAPTVLRTWSGATLLGSQVCEQAWPQEEAFERELHALLAMTAGKPLEGSTLSHARCDLTAARALWSACAASAGLDAEAGSVSGALIDER